MNIAQERPTVIQKHQSEQLFCQFVLNINESTEIQDIMYFKFCIENKTYLSE